MKFQGALIKEQGVTFGIVIVKPHVIQIRSEAEQAQTEFAPVFPGVPIVLMAQDFRGRPTYYGRSDLVDFLANTPVTAIPWKEYTHG